MQVWQKMLQSQIHSLDSSTLMWYAQTWTDHITKLHHAPREKNLIVSLKDGTAPKGTSTHRSIQTLQGAKGACTHGSDKVNPNSMTLWEGTTLLLVHSEAQHGILRWRQRHWLMHQISGFHHTNHGLKLQQPSLLKQTRHKVY